MEARLNATYLRRADGWFDSLKIALLIGLFYPVYEELRRRPRLRRILSRRALVAAVQSIFGRLWCIRLRTGPTVERLEFVPLDYRKFVVLDELIYHPLTITQRHLRRLKLRLRAAAGKDPESFFWKCRGVIHVGANVGQEAQCYEDRRLSVLWIEPIAEVFSALQRNIAVYYHQKAIRALVTDKTGGDYKLHVANNNGESSSIFEFAEHKDIWPEVVFERLVQMQGTTLQDLLVAHRLDIGCYDCLVMDTQGSELLVLKGAEKLLRAFKFIKTEAADFEAYKNCGRYSQIVDYLANFGFVVLSRRELACSPSGGKYFEVVFRRV